jgi:hypothetical protein
MSARRIIFAACLVAGWVAVLPTGVAAADCTGAGDFGAGAGCPPPGDSSGSGSSNSWPPTAVDWPPPQNSVSGDDAGAGGGTASTPIVMPNGQKAPPATHSESTSTSTPPKPIVPVGAPSVGTAPTTIVAPTASTP